MSRPPPARRFNKRLRLLGWALVHRVPPGRDVTTADLAKASAWFGGREPAKDPELTARWKEWIRNVLDRRARRRGWMQKHGSVPDGWTPPKGWEARADVRPPVKGAKGPSKRESNKAAWRAMRGPTCRELAAMRREQKMAIRAAWEAKCIAAGYDPKTGKRVQAKAA